MDPRHPHSHQPVLHAGVPIASARLVAVLIHGRGASAEDIIGLATEFSAGDVAYLATDYSIADIATFPWCARHEWQGVDLAEFPNVKRWYDTIAARPAVARGMAVTGS